MAFSPSYQSAKQLTKLVNQLIAAILFLHYVLFQKRNKINVIATIYERITNNSNTKYNNRVFDTAVMINNKGIICSSLPQSTSI